MNIKTLQGKRYSLDIQNEWKSNSIKFLLHKIFGHIFSEYGGGMTSIRIFRHLKCSCGYEVNGYIL